MILVRKNVYKDVCLLKNVSMFESCLEIVLEMCVCLFENRKDYFEIDQVTRSIIPTQKSFLYIFIPLMLLIYHCFGRQPYLWMLNGTGVGHRMTMIAMLPSIFSILRDQDHLFRQPFDSVIEGL